MGPQPTLRPISKGDLPFLAELYASTREAELAPLDWSQEQKSQFLQMQFDAQHAYYQSEFKSAAFQVILVDGQRVGRIYVDRRDSEIRLIDIAVLPRFRNLGIGSQLLGELLEEAGHAQKPIRIHVERHNPARRLYDRLGFVQVQPGDIYDLLEWSPG